MVQKKHPLFNIALYLSGSATYDPDPGPCVLATLCCKG